MNDNRMTELKSCPFCGGEAETWDGTGVWHVFCTNKDCAAMGSPCLTEAEAIDAWNTRAERTCKSMTDDNAWCFMCSECGKSFPRSKLRYAHNHGEINYCPNCGAKVVDE